MNKTTISVEEVPLIDETLQDEDVLVYDTTKTVKEEDEGVHLVNPYPLPVYFKHDRHEDVLSLKIDPVTDPLPNPAITNVVKRLAMTRRLHGGLGLSANQCPNGVLEDLNYIPRLFIMGNREVDIVCINPEIVNFDVYVENGKVQYSAKPGYSLPRMIKAKEGCLSYEELYLTIERPESCIVRFFDQNGKEYNVEYKDLTARIFQHEYDHLEGIIFKNHVGKVALDMAYERQRKALRKRKTYKNRM